MGGGGASKVLPLRKGGEAEKVLAILIGGCKTFPPFKILPCLGGGGCKKYRTRDFPIL